MGIPIPGFDIESDRVPRSNICLAVNCQCPECRHRHIIRLGSAIRQTRRQELQDLVQAAAAAENYIIPGITGAAANVIPSMGYIDTRLPDYRYRHSSSHSDAVNMRDYHGPTNLTTNNSRSGSDFSQSSASELYTPSGLNVNNISIVGSNSNTNITNIHNSDTRYNTLTRLNRRRRIGYRGPPLPYIISSSSAPMSNFLLPMRVGGGSAGGEAIEGGIEGIEGGIGGIGGGIGEGIGVAGENRSQHQFSVSPMSMVIDNHESEENQQEQHLSNAIEAATLGDRSSPRHQHPSQNQNQYRFQSSQMFQRPSPSSPLMRMRARTQEWASRVEGIDYYHDSDHENNAREMEGEEEESDISSNGRGRSSHREVIMDRHERSSSDIGIEYSSIR